MKVVWSIIALVVTVSVAGLGLTAAQAQSAPPGVAIDFRVVSSWAGGASVAVVVTNNSASDITNWSVSWQEDDPYKYTYVWDGQVAVTSGRAVGTPAESRNQIPVGEARSFGFNTNQEWREPTHVQVTSGTGTTPPQTPVPDPQEPSQPAPEPTPQPGGTDISTHVDLTYQAGVGVGQHNVVVLLKNISSVTLRDWQLNIDPGAPLAHVWNASLANDHVLEAAAKVATIEPGQTVAVGFTVLGSNTSAEPDWQLVGSLPQPTEPLPTPGPTNPTPAPPNPSPEPTPTPAPQTGPIIGVQTIGPHYQFTDQNPLVETAQQINQLGSTAIKFSLLPSQYGDSGWDYQFLRTLQDHPAYQEVLGMEFTHYFMWLETAGSFVDGDGLTQAEADLEYSRMYSVTQHLLQAYSGTGKAFYLGHWEGDWRLVDHGGQTQAARDRVEGMIQWLNIRQAAMNAAIAATEHHDVAVYHYVELNRVADAMAGKDRVANQVLPHVDVDLVSYSAYDTTVKTPTKEQMSEQLIAALNYVEGQLRPSARTLPFERRVFIGEYGFPLYNLWQYPDAGSEQDRRARMLNDIAADWGTPFTLYWQMYDNEYNAELNQYSGFWLINNEGQKQPLYYTLADMLSNQ